MEDRDDVEHLHQTFLREPKDFFSRVPWFHTFPAQFSSSVVCGPLRPDAELHLASTTTTVDG